MYHLLSSLVHFPNIPLVPSFTLRQAVSQMGVQEYCGRSFFLEFFFYMLVKNYLPELTQ